MNKPILGLVLGGILGIFDGLSALVSTPEVKPLIVGYATQRSRDAAKATAALLVLLLAAPALRAETTNGPVDPKATFQTLKGLAGTWEAPPLQEGTPPVKVVYAVSANGNVVVETLFQGTSHEMMTLY